VDDPAEDERFGRVGRQAITDTGPLTRKRMETIEDDLLARSLNFIDRADEAGKPFLLWTVLPAAAIVQQHVATFAEFPPRQAPPGFNPQGLVEAVLAAAAQRQGN
jgi:hypothetical protein